MERSQFAVIEDTLDRSTVKELPSSTWMPAALTVGQPTPQYFNVPRQNTLLVRCIGNVRICNLFKQQAVASCFSDDLIIWSEGQLSQVIFVEPHEDQSTDFFTFESMKQIAERSPIHGADLEIDLPSEALNFCYRNSLMEYIRLSINLIKIHFPRLKKISSEYMADPESNDSWILFSVHITEGVDSILDMFDKYTEAWLKSVPWPAHKKIRVSCFSAADECS